MAIYGDLEGQAKAWQAVWKLSRSLGMDVGGPETCGQDTVLHFIRTLAKKPGGKTFTIDVEHPGESAAGLCPFSDVITITVDSGNPGGVPGDFEEFCRDMLRDWFEGAYVRVRKEPGK